MKLRPDALPLNPAELIAVRKVIRGGHGIEQQLDVAEVAALLGYHRKTVLELARKGEFPGAWKPAHNQLRIPASAVRKFIEARQVAPAA